MRPRLALDGRCFLDAFSAPAPIESASRVRTCTSVYAKFDPEGHFIPGGSYCERYGTDVIRTTYAPTFRFDSDRCSSALVDAYAPTRDAKKPRR